MSVNIRLKEVRTTLKMSIWEFSREISYSHSVYGQTEIGKIPPNNRLIELIVYKFNVNKEWLLHGKGFMFSSKSKDLRLEKIIDIYNKVDDNLKSVILEQSKVILQYHKKK